MLLALVLLGLGFFRGLVGFGLMLQCLIDLLLGLGQRVEAIRGGIHRFVQLVVDLLLEFGKFFAFLLAELGQFVGGLLRLLANFFRGLGQILRRFFGVLAGVLCRGLGLLGSLVGRRRIGLGSVRLGLLAGLVRVVGLGMVPGLLRVGLLCRIGLGLFASLVGIVGLGMIPRLLRVGLLRGVGLGLFAGFVGVVLLGGVVVLGGVGGLGLLGLVEVLGDVTHVLQRLLDLLVGLGHRVCHVAVGALGLGGGLLVLLLHLRGLLGLHALLFGGLVGVFGNLVLALGGLFQFLGGSRQAIDLVFQFLPLGVLGSLGLFGFAVRLGLLRLFGRRLEIGDRLFLVGQGFGLFLLQEVVGGFLGLLLGLFQRGLHLRLGRRAQLVHFLGQFVLLRGEFIGGLGFQGLLLGLLVDLLLLVQCLGNLLLQGICVHGLLQVADLLQEGIQGGDHFRLAAHSGGEVATADPYLGLAQQGVDLLFLDHLCGLGGLAAHLAGEVNGLPQAQLELAEAGGHVALVFQGGQVQLIAAVGGLAGHSLRLLADFRLVLDELLDLAGQLGDLQPPQQDLLLDLDPHEDLAALGAGASKRFDALGVIVQIGLLQDLDHLFHLLVDHLVEMIPHRQDLGIPGMGREVVVAKLLKLHVEHFGHKLPGNVADLLLDLFLLLQPLGRNGLRLRMR